jgi:hypothetical protein
MIACDHGDTTKTTQNADMNRVVKVSVAARQGQFAAQTHPFSIAFMFEP